MLTDKKRSVCLAFSFWVVSVFFIPFSVFAEEQDVLREILTRKIAEAASLVSQATVTDAAKSQNKKWENISQAEIQSLDKQWTQSKEDDDYDLMVIRGFMTNECARTLLEFQRSNPDFKEIFITDKQGLNVCQTNKTSDFYQADEAWWVKSYAQGSGLSYSGEIEYDESVQSQSVSVFLPVRDPADGKTIGVCKAVIGLFSLVDDL